MANLMQIKQKVKTLHDFVKVVNIQKIVIMKEIAHWKQVIDKATTKRGVFITLVKKLSKKYHAVSPDIFETKKMGKKAPLKRNLHFIFQGNVQDALSKYELKIIAEYCRKNYQPNDVYIIIGENLADHLKKEKFKVLTTIPGKDVKDLSIYQRISYLIYEGYEDYLYIQSTVGFLDVATKQFVSNKIFPFPQEQELSKEEINLDDFSPIMKMKLGRVEWVHNFDIVVKEIIKNTIESSIYLNIAKYTLAMKKRELQALDDKEKNIKEEIELAKLKMQRIRKDLVTNELLTNATAFEALKEEEG